jgi:hypothetical protein
MQVIGVDHHAVLTTPRLTSNNTRGSLWHTDTDTAILAPPQSTSRAQDIYMHITYIVQVQHRTCTVHVVVDPKKSHILQQMCLRVRKRLYKSRHLLGNFRRKNPKNLCCIRYLVFTIQNSTRFRASCLHVLKILTTVLYSHFSGLLWQEDCKGSNATCYKVTSYVYKLCKITSSKCSKINSE